MPTITPAGPHIVVLINTPFELHCQGLKEMQWQRQDRPKVRGEKKTDGMSTLHISRALPVHMGRYICLEESSQEKSSIYVYVKGRHMSQSVVECVQVTRSSQAMWCLFAREQKGNWNVEQEEMFECFSLQSHGAEWVGVFAERGFWNFDRDRCSRSSCDVSRRWLAEGTTFTVSLHDVTPDDLGLLLSLQAELIAIYNYTATFEVTNTNPFWDERHSH